MAEYKSVKVFSTPTCPYCQMVKDFLDKHGVKFDIIDVTNNEKAAGELVNISGQMGVPVTVLEKEKEENQVIIGFDEKALKDALKISEK